jgi:hypothetical protein
MPSPRNGRKTEDVVRDELRGLGYYPGDGSIVVEEPTSDTPRIRRLLETASKRGGGVGKPEFLIRSAAHPDFLIVLSCKADPRHHVSATFDRYADFAADGVLLYASFLAKDCDVLAIAVSGQDRATLRVSHYIHLHGELKPVELPDVSSLLPFEDYYQALTHSEVKFRQDYRALLDFSRQLNHTLQARKVTEAERGFLISGILIALQNKAFKASVAAHDTAKQVAASLLGTIRGAFETVDLPEDRRDELTQAFSFIERAPSLIEDREFFVGLIRDIDHHVNRFRQTHEYYDTVGQFYVEFLRYANNDKGLGIVLTPPHVAELFADLAEVNRDSVVFDNCCGTGGLLIAALSAMMKDAGADSAARKRIRGEQPHGIEYQPKIYALAVSNMLLHGDGRTSIYRGDCFDDADPLGMRGRPTVGLLNPPYRNKKVKDDREELEYVLNNLEYLAPGAKCVAIVPITCATAPSGVIAELKGRLLERHTLEAVMSMPIELFHNSKTTVVTCTMVFTAHRPHPKGKKTWFGYWRDDGFVKTKHRGRIDLHGHWPAIRAKWVSAFRSREVIPRLSVLAEVGPHDEWCAEAYFATDYGAITREDLAEAAKRYALTEVMLLHESRRQGDDVEEPG